MIETDLDIKLSATLVKKNTSLENRKIHHSQYIHSISADIESSQGDNDVIKKNKVVQNSVRALQALL